jgi:SAM-dependent methyltransferase
VDAGAWDERYAGAALVWSATPNQFVAAELADLRPGRALDLACGEGRNALWLAERGWHVTAVDFSRVGLDKGRALQGRHPGGADLRVDWVLGDVLTHDIGPTPYDLAVLAYLQLTADQRRTAVRRAFGSLRPGGTFFLVAHDSSNLTEGTGGPTDPEVLFTAEEVLGDLDGERFEVERAERVGRQVATAPGGADAAEGSAHSHRGDATRTAYDALVRVVRT